MGHNVDRNEGSKFCGLKNLGQSLVLENGTAN